MEQQAYKRRAVPKHPARDTVEVRRSHTRSPDSPRFMNSHWFPSGRGITRLSSRGS